MGIESTKEISINSAIDRITEIAELVLEKDYRSIEASTYENDYNLEYFVNNDISPPLGDNILLKWTNIMLENQLDKPFYRRSMFENYNVVEGNI
tara:strand:- start:53067 stop:53348 length:282 start_codon:yes stop_codon:yes gene_type:complete